MIFLARPLLARLVPVIGMVMGAVIVYLLFLVTMHKSAVLACVAEYATHVAEDAKRETEAHQKVRDLEDAHHAALRDIATHYEEVRHEQEARMGALLSDLRAQRRRVRSALCVAPASDLPEAGPIASASSQEPTDGAGIVAAALGAAAGADAQYAELLAIAMADRRTCGTTEPTPGD